MKQQVLIIRGGETFSNYKEYISYLKNKKISLNDLKTQKGWKYKMANELGEDYEVFLPEMPNRRNSHYLEWKIWLEKIISILDDDLILIGSSLGGIFLAKYLSENKVSKKIKALILISAPFDDSNNEESLIDFKLPNSLLNISKQCKNIYLIQSKDDNIVPFDQVFEYKELLPKAEIIIFEDRGHFSQETFPEIVELIKQI